MELTNEFQPIRNWAEEKGIYSQGDIKTQALKLVEEAGELAKAILNDDADQYDDAIGDCTVVLTNCAKLGSIHFNRPMSLEQSVNKVYDIISKRKGTMKNGTFVKE